MHLLSHQRTKQSRGGRIRLGPPTAAHALIPHLCKHEFSCAQIQR
jgi:hypothetical protein